jgi:MGT family glycosyltransferase
LKKKILVIPNGDVLAHTSRALEIAKVLRNLGFEVQFASQGRYVRIIQDCGFEIIPIGMESAEQILKSCRKGRVYWNSYSTLKSYIHDDLELFRAVEPCLVVGDLRLSLSTSCEVARIPYVSIVNAAWTNYYSVRIRAPEHYWATRFVPPKVAGMLAPYVRRLILKIGHLPYAKVRRELKLEPRSNLFDIWQGDINLLPDIPEFAPTRDLPKNFHYVGPIAWEMDSEEPDWLSTLDPCRPIIYFTMGSTGDPRFFESALNMFGNSQYQCIITTGGMAALKQHPPNFFVADYAPGGKIMQKANVVVCHGGHGTIYQAMTYGVPIIGIPVIHDQEFNMQRVEYLGIGIQLSERRFKPQYLRQAIEQVLSIESYKRNIQKYQTVLKDYHGSFTAAKIIASAAADRGA